MRSAIENFAQQFAYAPEVAHKDNIAPFSRVVVLGMGGSRLPALILQKELTELPIALHNDYDLPIIAPEDAKKTLFIACSYSGNTEETLSGFETAVAKKLNVAVIAMGGTLIARAKELGIPRVELPNMNLQPRMATGILIEAMLAVLGKKENLQKISALSTTFDARHLEARGKELADRLKNFVPVIYASRRNEALAYAWKIKLNEDGKIPAFWNVLPELNHNEMTGFDRGGDTRKLSENFSFVFLEDADDHPRVQARMRVLTSLYEDRGLSITHLAITGATRYEKIFSSLVLGDWTGLTLAEGYGVEPEQVPMVEEFKKLIT
jgi:glucose/mannose-6-phosphate isomerase